MAITNIVSTRLGRVQFQGLFEHVVEFEADYNPASVNSNSFVAEAITVIGVHLGDFILANIDIDQQDLTLSVHIQSADTIDVHLFNPTAGAIDLGACNLHVIVLRPLHQH